MWYFVLLLCITLSKTVELPSNFKKCNRNEVNWKQCVLNAAVHGIPQLTKPYDELKIPSLNPFVIKEINITAGSSKLSVNQYLTDVNIYGLLNQTISKFEFDFENKILSIAGTFPKIEIKSNATVDGKILVLNVHGTGYGTTTIENLNASAVFHFETYARKNKTYLKITSSELKMKPKLIKFDLANLFGNDKVISDRIMSTLNENWEIVYEDVKQDYKNVVQKIFTSLLNNFFSKVSIEEAFD